MTLPVSDQVRYWSFATAIFVVLMWLLGDVLLPFVLGGAIAYFLDPVADRLEKMGTTRVMATAIITLVALLIFTIVMLLVVPALIRQSISLFNSASQLVRDFSTVLTQQFPSLMDADSTMLLLLLLLCLSRPEPNTNLLIH